MQKPFYKKNETSDFKSPVNPKSFLEETTTSKELLQKELDVNRAEQVLLDKRIQMMKQFINDLPSSDPQYGMLATQIQMDQIELDELKTRAMNLSEKLTE